MRHLLPFFVALVVAPLPVHAERQACLADLKKFCIPQPGRRVPARKCLTDHLAELQPECRAFVERANGEMKALRDACDGDVKKLCADLAAKAPPDPSKGPGAPTKGPGEPPRAPGGVVGCLLANEAKLSEACRTALAKRRRGGPGAPVAPPPAKAVPK